MSDYYGSDFVTIVDEDGVDESDDGRFSRHILEIDFVDIVFFLADFDIFQVKIFESCEICFEVVIACLSLSFCAIILIDGGSDGLLSCDDNLNVVSCEEFEVIDREHIGRIAHDDDELHAASVDGNTGMFDGHVPVDAFQDIFTDFADIFEAHRGDAELPAEEARHILFADEAEFCELS